MSQSQRVVAVSVANLLALMVLTLVIGHAFAQDKAQVTPSASSPAEQAPAAPAAPPAKPAVVPPPKVVLDNNEVSGILGKEVQSAAKEDMGHIIDVIVDRAGNARAAIIDFGGFLGVGSRKIAVDWNALHFSVIKGKELITLDLTKDQVKAAPEFQEGKPVVVLGALDAISEFGALSNPNLPQLTSKTPER